MISAVLPPGHSSTPTPWEAEHEAGSLRSHAQFLGSLPRRGGAEVLRALDSGRTLPGFINPERTPCSGRPSAWSSIWAGQALAFTPASGSRAAASPERVRAGFGS